MSQIAERGAESFVDRRGNRNVGKTPHRERRQFANNYDGLSPDAHDLATAIDEYKLMHRRRFITYEEMHSIIVSLGYSK